jgi:hypothetical protein
MLFEFEVSHPEQGVLRSGVIAYSSKEGARTELLHRIATRKEKASDAEPKYGPEVAKDCKVTLKEKS